MSQNKNPGQRSGRDGYATVAFMDEATKTVLAKMHVGEQEVQRQLSEFLRGVAVAKLESMPGWEKRLDDMLDRRIEVATKQAVESFAGQAELERAVRAAILQKATAAIADQYEIEVSVAIRRRP